MDWKTIIEIIAVVGSVGSLAYNILVARSKNRLDSADYAGQVAKAAAGLINPYEHRLQQLEAQVISLTTTVSDLHTGIDILITQIEKLGHMPVWRPKK